MRCAIVGLGTIGSSIARAFARAGLEVTVAGRRPPEALAPLAAKIGPEVRAGSLAEALRADIVILAVPFAAHREIAGAAASWHGRLVIDAMNAYGVPPEQLGGLPSTAAVARTLAGARLVKAFNHLPGAVLDQGPAPPQGGRRVIFVAGDDDPSCHTVAELVERLGFAAVQLGRLDAGGLLIQARGRAWGPLIFQDLVKFA